MAVVGVDMHVICKDVVLDTVSVGKSLKAMQRKLYDSFPSRRALQARQFLPNGS